ncbi:MAG: tetratricopeptide repeat protein [Anaerolineae bacterium]|nr:tetratricopeptide repeat protein [Anaerolineae bacterium]
MMRAVGGWDAMTQLEAARSLSKRQHDSDDLRDALTVLMGTFMEELLEQNMVQHQHIDISGSVTGGNIVIGGYQIVAGDLIIQYITQQKIRACPTAPKPPAHFAGRLDELNRLKEVLGQGQSVAITGIQGVGGIGKTALSLQLASEMSEFSAVLWASLGPNPNTGNQLIEWARHADPDFDPGQDDIDMLANRVQALLTNLIQEQCPGRVLVILDDIWEGDSVRTARALQKAAPVNSVSLITTRSQLVVAQLRSTRLELQPMMPADSLQMLRNLLSDYPDIPDDTLLELAEVVGYHPLAMELAAGQVTLLERPTTEITDQIERYRGGIPAGSPFRDIGLELGKDREDNLEVVLAFSYDSLTEIEQSQFRALGVLAYNAPFDSEICNTIWETESKTILDNLRHRALLSIAEKEGWYQQHVLLRSYARALLSQFGEVIDINNRYINYVNLHALRFDELPLEDWKTFEAMLPHIDYIGDVLLELYESQTLGNGTPLQEFAWRVMSYVAYRNFTVEEGGKRLPHGLKWLEAGLRVLESQGNKERQAAMLNSIGHIYGSFGDADKALEYYDKALPIRRLVGDRLGEAVTLNNIGYAWAALGDKHKALEYYDKALPIRQSVGDRLGEAATLNNIGFAWSTSGDYDKAIIYYHQALDIFRDVSDRLGEATTITNIGAVLSRSGENLKALEYYKQALPIFESIDDPHGQAAILANSGSTEFSLGELHKALDFYLQAQNALRLAGDRQSEATVMCNIANVHSKLGDRQSALDYHEAALSLRREIRDLAGEGHSLHSIGFAWSVLGDKQKALNYYNQALKIRRDTNDPVGETTTLINIGTIWSVLGNTQESLDSFQKALLLSESLKEYAQTARILNSIAGIYIKLGNNSIATDYCSQAISLMQKHSLLHDSAGRSLDKYQEKYEKLLQSSKAK